MHLYEIHKKQEYDVGFIRIHGGIAFLWSLVFHHCYKYSNKIKGSRRCDPKSFFPLQTWHHILLYVCFWESLAMTCKCKITPINLRCKGMNHIWKRMYSNDQEPNHGVIWICWVGW
jgi:hypothetical protein